MERITSVTLDDFIKSKSTGELNFCNFDIQDISMDKEIFMSRNVLNDYIDDVSEKCVLLHLSDRELYEYKYRPRLLSYKLYGDPHYYYILLLLNNMCDEKQFNRKSIKILRSDDMINVLSAIYNANMDLIKYHTDYIEEKKME